MAKADLNFTLLIEQAITRTEEHYTELISKLTDRRDAILNALIALNKDFIENQDKCTQSIANINLLTCTISEKFKGNDSLEKNFREEQDKLFEKHKEMIWKRMENSAINFEHKICIDSCVRASGSIQMEGGITKSIEKLNLDRKLFELGELQFYKGVDVNASLDPRHIPLDESLLTESTDFVDIAQTSVAKNNSGKFAPLLTSPEAVCIDPGKQLVYAVNSGKVPRICVFTMEGEYVETIRPDLPKGNTSLYGICVGRGRIYLTDTQNNMIIAISQNGGKFLDSTRGRSVFNSIQNLAIDLENGQIFACDKNASKIRIFDERLHKKYHFGERFLTGPRDVKIREFTVIVLDSGDYSLCYFSKTGVLLGHSITFFTSYTPFLGGIFFAEKVRVQFFDIDEEGNSYITNFNSAAIHKFDMFGAYLSLSGKETTDVSVHSKGIAVGSKGKVVYACTNKSGSQIQSLSPN